MYPPFPKGVFSISIKSTLCIILSPLVRTVSPGPSGSCSKGWFLGFNSSRFDRSILSRRRKSPLPSNHRAHPSRSGDSPCTTPPLSELALSNRASSILRIESIFSRRSSSTGWSSDPNAILLRSDGRSSSGGASSPHGS